jgi:hypothetical protein
VRAWAFTKIDPLEGKAIRRAVEFFELMAERRTDMKVPAQPAARAAMAVRLRWLYRADSAMGQAVQKLMQTTKTRPAKR